MDTDRITFTDMTRKAIGSRVFAGPGEGKGKFKVPHGIWVDSRPGVEPRLVVTDRAHNTMQLLTLEGDYIEDVGRIWLARQYRHVSRLDADSRTGRSCDDLG